MNVRELIAALAPYDPDMLVYYTNSGDGNADGETEIGLVEELKVYGEDSIHLSPEVFCGPNYSDETEIQQNLNHLTQLLEHNSEIKVCRKPDLDEILKKQISAVLDLASLISSHEDDKYSRCVDELDKALGTL